VAANFVLSGRFGRGCQLCFESEDAFKIAETRVAGCAELPEESLQLFALILDWFFDIEIGIRNIVSLTAA